MCQPFKQMPALPQCPLPKTQYHQQSSAERRRRKRWSKDGTDLIERKQDCVKENREEIWAKYFKQQAGEQMGTEEEILHICVEIIVRLAWKKTS